MFRASLILALLLGVGAVAAADDSASTGEYYTNPARDIEFSNVQHLSRSPRILVPTMYVKFARWGRVPLRLADSDKPGAEMTIDAPVPVEALRDITARLHENFISHVKRAGWEVLTQEDVRESAIWKGLPQVDADRRFGVPFEQANVGGDARRYLVLTPASEPVIASGATGPAWTMKDLVEEFQATVMVVTYTFDVIPFVPSAAAVAANPASGPLSPRLELLDVNIDFRTPGLVGGSIRTRVAQLAHDTCGAFTVPRVKEDRQQQALEDASVGRGKGDLVLDPEPDVFAASALAIAGAFNSQAVQTISVYAPK